MRQSNLHYDLTLNDDAHKGPTFNATKPLYTLQTTTHLEVLTDKFIVRTNRLIPLSPEPST